MVVLVIGACFTKTNKIIALGVNGERVLVTHQGQNLIPSFQAISLYLIKGSSHGAAGGGLKKNACVLLPSLLTSFILCTGVCCLLSVSSALEPKVLIYFSVLREGGGKEGSLKNKKMYIKTFSFMISLTGADRYSNSNS